MRGAGVETPVLMISALSDVDERVKGLRAGGDDYMTKPFASEELAARLEVLLRRRTSAPRQTTLTVGDLEIDLGARGPSRRGRGPADADRIQAAGVHGPQLRPILTRTMIFEAVWGYHFDPGTNLIDVHMGRLRKKVDRPGLPQLLHTVRGSGYALHAPA